MYDVLQNCIEHAYEQMANLDPGAIPDAIYDAVLAVIAQLDKGEIRICEKQGDTWHVHTWIKKAILLYFKIIETHKIDGSYAPFFDKVPAKYADYTLSRFQAHKTRVVPPTMVRKGAYIGPGSVLMPCFVNIGAHVGEGTMVDTWATVGSCAQIGHHVHLSGGVGIGGVLEPLQANPVIIEDHCFIGARSEIVEGVIVEKNAVISMGVYLSQSTKIYDRESKQISYGRIPEGAVVVPGNLPAPDGSHSLYCAVIVKRVDAKTKKKIGINEILRSL